MIYEMLDKIRHVILDMSIKDTLLILVVFASYQNNYNWQVIIWFRYTDKPQL